MTATQYSARNFVPLTDAKLDENFYSPRVRDNDSWRESRLLFSVPGCVLYTELFRQESVSRTDEFFLSVDLSVNLASKGAIFVRGEVLKSTLLVENDTTVQGVHTNKVAFSPSVLIKCSFCSCHPLMRTLHMNGSRKRSSAYDTESHYFINLYSCLHLHLYLKLRKSERRMERHQLRPKARGVFECNS